jgi:hypothetical protein
MSCNETRIANERGWLEWSDAMTGRPSQSLGAHTYEQLLRDAGLTWVAGAQDEGENHCYFVERRR